MATPRQTSEDGDWQEIDTDSFSVVSLSTEAESTDEVSEHEAQARQKGDAQSQQYHTKEFQHGFEVQTLTGNSEETDTTAFSSRSTRPNSADSATLVRKPSVETLAAGLQALEISETNSKQDPAKDHDHNNVGSSSPSPSGDPCAATNPSYLHSIVTSARKHVNDITSLAIDMSPFLSAHLVSGETSALVLDCKKLDSQLQTLSDIISGYVKHRDSARTSYDGTPIPLDPGLHDWLSTLRTELTDVEKLMQYQLDHQHKDLFDQFEVHTQALTELAIQMEGFLPILVVDFDEFHTAEMTYQSLSDHPDMTPAQHAHRSSQTQIDNKDIVDLRRAMYDLKDQINSSETELNWLQTNSASIPICSRHISKVHKAYITIRNTLNQILSNNPSDWLDYSIAGGLTYAEFARISPEDVRSLKGSLKEATDDLFLQRCNVQNMRYLNDPDGNLQSDEDSLKAEFTVHLDGLQTIGEVLTSLFVREAARGGS